MPVSFSVKNVPDAVAKALRARAKRNHRSLQGELLAVLEAAARPSPRTLQAPRHPRSANARRRGRRNRWTLRRPSRRHPRSGATSSAGCWPSRLSRCRKREIAEFCHRWRITEFSLFGSVLRDDFRPDSDIDVLVRFEPDAPWSLFDLGDMQAELGEIFGRKVDLVEKGAIEKSRHRHRRRHILDNHRVIYAA